MRLETPTDVLSASLRSTVIKLSQRPSASLRNLLHSASESCHAGRRCPVMCGISRPHVCLAAESKGIVHIPSRGSAERGHCLPLRMRSPPTKTREVMTPGRGSDTVRLSKYPPAELWACNPECSQCPSACTFTCACM